MTKRTLSLLLAALLLLTALPFSALAVDELPPEEAPADELPWEELIPEVEEELHYEETNQSSDDIWLNSAFYQQETSGGCVLASCAMVFENAWGRTVSYVDNGTTYTGFQAVYHANGQIDSAQWNKLYNAFNVKANTFIHTAEYGTRTAAQVESLFLSNLRSNPNGILAFFKDSKSGSKTHAVVIVGYKDGIFYVNDPARNVSGRGIAITQSYVAKSIVNSTSQDTILQHIGFAETYSLTGSMPVTPTSNISFSVTAPADGEIITASVYNIVGTISSEYYQLDSVRAYLDGSSEPYAERTNLARNTFELKTSNINYNLVFSDLSQGMHTLRIEATDTNGYTAEYIRIFYIKTTAPLNFTVFFDASDGYVSTNSKTVTYGSIYDTLPTPTRTGCKFRGWWLDGTGYIYDTTTVNIAQDHTLYAAWEWIGYTVSFDANGGSTSLTSKTVFYGSDYGELPSPSRTGYSFDGWFTAATGGSQVTSTTEVSNAADHTLYAHWTIIPGLFIDSSTFPDEGFRNWVKANLAGGKDFMTANEVAAVTDIYCGGMGIHSAQGIEYFPNLKWLNLGGIHDEDTIYENYLTSLDISKNTALTHLNCEYNQLTSLDVSKNTALTFLSCDYNRLTSLDMSNNTALNFLSCSGNLLTKLDLSYNAELEELWCSNNALSSLDVSNNAKLLLLFCGGNELVSLDISHNPVLKELVCWGNQLTEIDLTHNSELYAVYCQLNRLTSIEVSGNPALGWLACNDNLLNSLNISKNTELEWLRCGNNQLSALDISKNKNLRLLHCDGNQLTSLDISQNANLFCEDDGDWPSEFNCSNQTKPAQTLIKDESVYSFNLSPLVADKSKVTVRNASYDVATGIVTFTNQVDEFSYVYAVGYEDEVMDVTVKFGQLDDHSPIVNPEAVLTVSSGTVRAGGTQKVSVSISEGSKAEVMEFAVLYDSSKLTLDLAEPGEVMKNLAPTINSPTAGVVLFNWDSLTALTAGGSLLELTFTVKANASGTAAVTVPANGSAYDFYLIKMNGSATVNIPTAVENGGLTIVEYVLGDVNGDEKVNAIDANLIRRYAAKLITLDATQLLAADVSGDGKVNAIDANLIRRYAAKLINTFPAEGN